VAAEGSARARSASSCRPRHAAFLRGIFRRQQELLLDLSQCAAEAVGEHMRRQLRADTRPGIVVSIATSGNLVQWHPHGHLLVSDGAFSDDGTYHRLETWDGDAVVPLEVASIKKMQPAGADWAAGVEERLSALLAAASGYETDRAAVQSSARLSDEGKAHEAGVLARKLLVLLGAFEQDTVGKLRARADERGRAILKLAASKRPSDLAERMAYELRLHEIRGELWRLDPVERLNVYFSAHDPAAIDAIESAPPPAERRSKHSPAELVPFVDPETVAAAVIERARKLDPAAAEEVEGRRYMARTYEPAIGGIRNVVLQDVPSARPDVVPALAGAR
jgi:hypothetical protein